MVDLLRNSFVQPVEGVSGGIPIPVTTSGASNKPTFATNQKDVTAAGTAEQLQAQAIPDGFTVFLRAKVDNMGTIWVGPDKATAEDHTKATPLEPGAFLTLGLTNTNEIWIDADNSGEGVAWTVEV